MANSERTKPKGLKITLGSKTFSSREAGVKNAPPPSSSKVLRHRALPFSFGDKVSRSPLRVKGQNGRIKRQRPEKNLHRTLQKASLAISFLERKTKHSSEQEKIIQI